LDQLWLKSELGIEVAPGEIDKLRKMDAPSKLSDLAGLGRLAVAKQVKPEHVPAAFDLPKGHAWERSGGRGDAEHEPGDTPQGHAVQRPHDRCA
jgi:hypothetical protein